MVLTLQGVVENGQIRLQSNVTLPEQAKGCVVVPGVEAPPARVPIPRLATPEQAVEFVKQVIEAPADAEL